MLTDCPATVRVAKRATPEGPTAYDAPPEPLDDDPLVMVATDVSLDTEFQPHPLAVVTDTEPLPPSGPTTMAFELRTKLQALLRKLAAGTDVRLSAAALFSVGVPATTADPGNGTFGDENTANRGHVPPVAQSYAMTVRANPGTV
jgi:hypothetical protein